jgi:hypothetical protein
MAALTPASAILAAVSVELMTGQSSVEAQGLLQHLVLTLFTKYFILNYYFKN